MITRLLITPLLLGLLGVSLAAQADRAEREAYARKLAEPFAKHVPWVAEFEEALRRSRAENKLVLAWFTRSYAPCPACRAYESGPLVSDWWREEARSFIPYLNVSARLDDKPDQGLVIEKGGSYFPYCILMDGRGRPLVEFRPLTRQAVVLAREEGSLHARLLAASDDPKDLSAVRALRLFRAIRGEARLGVDAMRLIASEPEQDAELVARFEDYLRRRRVREAFAAAQKKVREVPAPEESGAEARRRHRAAKEAKLAAEMYPLLAEGLSFRVETNPAMFLNYAILATRGAVAASDRKAALRGLAMIREGEAAYVPPTSMGGGADDDRGALGPGFGDRAAFRSKIGFAELERAVQELPQR
jgi:hypothetical protein